MRTFRLIALFRSIGLRVPMLMLAINCSSPQQGSSEAMAGASSRLISEAKANVAETLRAGHLIVLAGETSNDTFVRAWVVTLRESSDARNVAGTVYLADSNSACASMGPGDTLHWSAVDGARQYDHTGVRASGGWRGVLQSVDRDEPAARAHTDSLRLTESARAHGGQSGTVVRVFSSARVHDETGDLLGTDLMLAGAADSLIAVVAMNEGVAGAPRLRRLARRQSDSMWFAAPATAHSASADANAADSQMLVVLSRHRAEVMFGGMTDTLEERTPDWSRVVQTCRVPK